MITDSHINRHVRRHSDAPWFLGIQTDENPFKSVHIEVR